MSRARAPGESRARRRESSKRRTGVRVLVGAVLALAVGVALFLTIGGDGSPGREGPPPPGSTAPDGGRSRLLVLVVRTAPQALFAVIGSGGGRRPAAVTVPAGLHLTLPGRGDTDLSSVADLPGRSLGIGISNLIGAWAPHFAVTDLAGLSAGVDAAGGVTIPPGTNLPGPSDVALTGAQLASFLTADSTDNGARWRAALTGLLAGRVPLSRVTFADTDDPAAAKALISAARGASVGPIPVQKPTPGLVVPNYPAIQQLVASRFGFRRPPVPVSVLNGSGLPGIGEEVAARLLPAGFRVVESGNADTFKHNVTQVAAIGVENQAAAARALRALGVGKLALSKISSGLVDVTIVVGKDFSNG